MRKIIIYITCSMALMATISECKKPYLPPVISSNTSYLVVEGVIDPGQDSTIIRLSHTVQLSSTAGPRPELNATVVVESNTNTSYPLQETGNGYYVSTGLNLNASNQYHLKITTSDNKVYQSDFVPVKNSLPIDSVGFQIKSNGVQINVNSHDPSNSTRYYRWDYSETWIIHSNYESFLELQTSPVDSIVTRPSKDQIYTCWLSDKSSDIVLASTAKLSNDVVSNSPIIFIASTSEKFTERYTILVKQYALTKEAFDYFQELRKNTEQLGGIFDPQPSALTGNVHCITNPSEQVIGYITAGSSAQKRIYINAAGLPVGGQWIPSTSYSYTDCLYDTLYYTNPKTLVHQVAEILYTGDQIPLTRLQYPGAPHPYAYTGAAPVCVDCTLRGSNKPPPFWVNK
jgi:hypothetical protein